MKALFSLLLVIAPLHFETGRFTIYQDGKKIGTEEFTITPVSTGYLVEGHTVIKDSSQDVDLKSKMALDANLKTKSYEFQSKGSSIKMTVGLPTSEIVTTVEGETRSDDFRFPEDGFIVDANFFHHYAILLYRIRAAVATDSVSAFVPQELELGQLRVKNVGNNTYEMDPGNLKVIATTDKDGRLIRLTVPEAKVVVER